MAAPSTEVPESTKQPPAGVRPGGRAALAAGALVLLLAICWLPSYLGGGADSIPPLWPFLPIVLAALRFGLPGALASAALAAIIAGPLTPADVAHGTPQSASAWITRAFFFLAMAAIVGLALRGLQRESGAHLLARERLASSAAALEADVAERRQLEDRLRSLAFRDTLTGLANRRLLEEHLSTALARARRAALGVALVYIDLNDFKLVNDGLGHAAGDELLRQVARRLAATARESDLVARHGGDEFLVMISDIAPGTEGIGAAAEAVASGLFERIARALSVPFAIGEAEFRIEASAGVSIFPVDAFDTETLHKHADAAMYVAKAARTGIAIFDSASTEDPLAPLSGAVGVRRALQRGELELHYQPIVRLSDMRTLGIEALVRWRDPERGLVPPGEFLPIAEQTGMIDEIGDVVLAELCRQAQRWLADGLAPKLGVNVSPRQLRVPGFAERFARRVHDHGLAPSSFVVELTESAWTVEGSRMRPVLDELRAQGFALAIDDFGAGYSSLSRLLDLPVDVIKIDRAFLSSIPYDPQAVAIVTAIRQLADACGCDVVAEGVENDAQRDFLFGQGCLLGQGFGLGRPVPEDEMTAVLHATLVDERRSAHPLLSAELYGAVS